MAGTRWLAELRKALKLTRQQVAERTGVTKGRVSQIERGLISTRDVLARYAEAPGGRLQQTILFPGGDIAVIARVAAPAAAPVEEEKAAPRPSAPSKRRHADAAKTVLTGV
jgi:transcriptional regulator with XRE-family HTH domain